jgi:hypothetical protein
VCFFFLFIVVFSGSGGSCNKEGRGRRWKEGGEVEEEKKKIWGLVMEKVKLQPPLLGI